MNTQEFTKKVTQSPGFRYGLITIAVLVLFIAGLSAGEGVGFHKAEFTLQNGNNYYHPTQFSDAHGTVGKVIAVTLPTITIEDHDNTEKTVLISDQTVIRQFRNTLTKNDIKEGDYIVAIGDPNAQSQIAATLIRVLPPPSPR